MEFRTLTEKEADKLALRQRRNYAELLAAVEAKGQVEVTCADESAARSIRMGTAGCAKRRGFRVSVCKTNEGNLVIRYAGKYDANGNGKAKKTKKATKQE